MQGFPRGRAGGASRARKALPGGKPVFDPTRKVHAVRDGQCCREAEGAYLVEAVRRVDCLFAASDGAVVMGGAAGSGVRSDGPLMWMVMQ